MSYIDPDQFHGALNSTITFLKDADNQADLTAGGVVPATLQTKLGGILSDQETKKAARDKAKTAPPRTTPPTAAPLTPSPARWAKIPPRAGRCWGIVII